LDYFYSSKSEIQGQEVNSQQAPNLLLLLLLLLHLLPLLQHPESMPNGSSSKCPLYSTFWMKILDAQKHCETALSLQYFLGQNL
jgi:hypothetical protein